VPAYDESNNNRTFHRYPHAAPAAATAWAAAVRLTLACFVMALASACATRPPASDYKRDITHALPASAPTDLGAALAPFERTHPDESGFRVLSNGTDALQMRIALARAATKTLDMQYYIANEDTTGKLLLAAALYAADKGVRVRMLVDDLNFKDIDEIMAALNTHDNIDIRVFNPFGSSKESVFQRTTSIFTKIGHFTQRMHNKAMIADNQLSIVGGRNLGDEYFSASETLQFRDIDVLAAGPITADISESFDAYWNSSASYPLRVLNKQKFEPKELDQTREELRDHWRKNADPYNAKPLNASPLAAQIAKDDLGLIWAHAEFKADTPEKITDPSPDYRSPPLERLVALANEAQKEILIISPYFVPRDAGVKSIEQITHRGVRVAVLTNSLAATDAVAVQAGYAPYRVPLLQNGVELYEFKPIQQEGSSRVDFVGSTSRSSLHAKVFVIDRSTLVIGSMNLDPRSANLNTELVLIIHSPPLADRVATLFDRSTEPTVSYHVTLATPDELARLRATSSPPSKLVWTGEENGRIRTYNLDPNAGFYRNAMTGLFLLLPIDSQL
jgi:putative cardiolipin synthase